MNAMPETREQWSSRIGFILSNIGAAIGLGSIWKFPYEAGANGGAAFIFFYLVGLVAVVFPLTLLEFSIGRRGQTDAVGCVAAVAAQSGASAYWASAAAVGVTASFLILSFYSVIGGWSLNYVVETAVFGLAGNSAADAQAQFDSMLASPLRMSAYHAAFMAVTALIVARGITNGIETACKILMPILVVLILVLAVYAMSQGDAAAALRFLFGFDRMSITPKVALEALGLGFFSIGVGLAVMITYGSHAQNTFDLREVAVATIIGDTTISFMAGLVVFPVVFAEKLNPASGPGLTFVTLPLALAHLPFGRLAAFAFFALLTVAAVASAISFLELPVALLQRHLRFSRRLATLVSAVACYALGLASVLSFNMWAAWHPLAFLGLPNATIFDLLDDLTSNMLLPLGSFALAIFGGWVMSPTLLVRELRLGPFGSAVTRGLLRFVAPAAIAAATFAAVRF
jgi:neurotransmitter:Na+ symporter, NSS family